MQLGGDPQTGGVAGGGSELRLGGGPAPRRDAQTMKGRRGGGGAVRRTQEAERPGVCPADEAEAPRNQLIPRHLQEEERKRRGPQVIWGTVRGRDPGTGHLLPGFSSGLLAETDPSELPRRTIVYSLVYRRVPYRVPWGLVN